MAEPRWGDLAARVVSRRTERGWTREQVLGRGGPSITLQQTIEKTGGPLRRDSYAKIEAGLRWKPGSVESILGGGEPTPLTDGEIASSTESADSLVSPRHIVVLLPESTRDATDAEREEMEAAAKAAALRIYREQRQGRSKPE